jgi:predicted DNA-binding transcriptional regulator AlpA
MSETQFWLALTVEVTAHALGISRAFAYEAVARGEIPRHGTVRVGDLLHRHHSRIRSHPSVGA